MRKNLGLVVLLILILTVGTGVASAAEQPITLDLAAKEVELPTVLSPADLNANLLAEDAEEMFTTIAALNRIYANYGIVDPADASVVKNYMESKDKAIIFNNYGGVWNLYKNEDDSILFCGATDKKAWNGWFYVFYINIE